MVMSGLISATIDLIARRSLSLNGVFLNSFNQPAGTYVEKGPRGGNVPGGRVVHIDKGDRLPPTQKPGNGWIKQ
jgi:hypothetical protein|nr:MAG TPA: YjzC-like protein [Caudoviricetes sp.]